MSKYREYKFRGQDDSGKWHYGSLITMYDNDGELCYFIFEGRKSELQNIEPWDDFILVKPETVGQYIGIKDTSTPPKKIYEGDIIEDESGIRHLVRYNPSKARYEAVLLPKSTWHRWDIAGDIGQDWVNEFLKKVIGDIHTNPELIKKEV